MPAHSSVAGLVTLAGVYRGKCMTDDDLSDTAELELMDTAELELLGTDEMKQLPDPETELADVLRPESDAPVNEEPDDGFGFDPYNHS